jgi:glycerophosphoryl diester phosphodiesterase
LLKSRPAEKPGTFGRISNAAGALALAFAMTACSSGSSRERPPGPPVARIAPDDLSDFFDCLRRENAILVVAHRGGPARGFPENALHTFDRTLSMAPALIETDVSMTQDGELVLMHDETVERTTNGRGRVADMTTDDFRALKLKDETGAVLNARPPTLREALEWAKGKTILELDVKRGVPFERVVDAVDDADAEDRVIVVAHSEAETIIVHRLNSGLMISAPIQSGNDVERLRRANINLDRILAWTGTREPNVELNTWLRARGIEVLFGTLGGRDSWDARFARDGARGYGSFAQLGLQMIASDRPQAAHQALDQWDGEGWAASRCLGR